LVRFLLCIVIVRHLLVIRLSLCWTLTVQSLDGMQTIITSVTITQLLLATQVMVSCTSTMTVRIRSCSTSLFLSPLSTIGVISLMIRPSVHLLSLTRTTLRQSGLWLLSTVLTNRKDSNHN
jgi:hypothetical protein